MLDYLINKPFENLTKDDFLKVYNVNIFGVAELTQICIPYLKKRESCCNNK